MEEAKMEVEYRAPIEGSVGKVDAGWKGLQVEERNRVLTSERWNVEYQWRGWSEEWTCSGLNVEGKKSGWKWNVD